MSRPVEVGTQMLVFDANHSVLEERKWKPATVIEITMPVKRDSRGDLWVQAQVHAKVAWLDGSVSHGHLVQRMRYLHSAETPCVAL